VISSDSTGYLGVGLPRVLRGYRQGEQHEDSKEKVKIEEWTYNPGPTEFIRYLRFENGILTNISTGDKGF
jgi:hypothetical protein